MRSTTCAPRHTRAAMPCVPVGITTRTAATRRFIDRALAPLAQRQSVWRQEPPNPPLQTPVPQNRDCFRGVSAIDGRKTKRPRGQASRGRSWCRGRSVVRSPVHVQDQIGRFDFSQMACDARHRRAVPAQVAMERLAEVVFHRIDRLARVVMTRRSRSTPRTCNAQAPRANSFRAVRRLHLQVVRIGDDRRHDRGRRACRCSSPAGARWCATR